MEVPETEAPLQQIRWGIVGPGRAGARFAEGLKAIDAASLDAVWGRNPERTHCFVQKFNVPQAFASLRELLSADVDAIYVATHPDSHAEICLHALAAGKHVLCEKPATLNERQLSEVLEAAHGRDRLFMEAGFSWRQ